MFSASLWLNKLLLNRRGTESAERKTEILRVTLKGLVLVAIEYYRQSIAMQPTLAEAHYHLGIAFQKLGNLDDAIAHYQSAQALQPDWLEAKVSLANR